MPLREIAAGLGDGHTTRRRDAVGPAFVVLEVGVERLLEVEAFDVLLQLRPAGEAVLARELQLRVGKLHLVAVGAARTHALFRLLAQLLQVEDGGHCNSFPLCPSSADPGGKKSVTMVRRSTRVGSALSADWTRPRPRCRDSTNRRRS